jgi:hypothetical protein
VSKHDFGQRWHEQQLGSVDDEIAKMAFICGIPLLDPGIVERVVAGDEGVCTKPNPEAFRKLRGLVGMHYMLTGDSLKSLGPDETARILAQIRERLQTRFKLGGT